MLGFLCAQSVVVSWILFDVKVEFSLFKFTIDIKEIIYMTKHNKTEQNCSACYFGVHCSCVLS